MKRLRRAALACAAVIAIAFVPSLHAATPANASAAGFNPGNIIDDAVFYNSNAMSINEIQVFLNQKLASCRIGTPPYMPGWPSPSGTGNTIASNCLKDFRQTTSSRAADRYCQGYAGATNETAAQIIAKVAKSCSISPKVLLVMLEKEQSLVTDSWPVTRQYNYALGMNCPDSGPGNSANCDAASAGFSLQLYMGARQLQVYKGNPGSFNFSPGRYNTIQWHPNPGCGTSQVWIENWATASLYIYTPYRPNSAALNAGWGTGDGCSSYGNRNFYLFYTSWFGSPRGFQVWGDTGAYWTARGGGSSIYGYPTSNSSLQSTRFSGGTWVQTFSGGVITTEMNTGKTVGVPYGRIYDHWNLVDGGIYGVMGAPVSEPTNYSDNGGGVLQWFQGGLMVSANQQGTVASVPYGRVYDFYNNSLGGIYGVLGYPTSSMMNFQGGQLQNFQKGFISQAAGSNTLVSMAHGDFFNYYNGVAGGIYGKLGFPVAAQTANSSGVLSQQFVGGFLMQQPGGAVVEISGPTYAAYREAENNGVALGAPVASEQNTSLGGGATFVQFQTGVIVTPKSSGKPYAIGGATFSHYNSVLGGFAGAYGYPDANVLRFAENGGGTLQFFRGGIIFVSDRAQSVSAMRFDSPIYKRYNGTEGGIYGWLGYPIQDEVRLGDGTLSQKFQNGVIVVSPSGVVTALSEATAALYQAKGGSGGPLGAPLGAPNKYSVGTGAVLTFFAGGIITQESRTGTAASLVYTSPIYSHYNTRAGGIYGTLGYPMGEEATDSSGALAQAYQNGVLRRSPSGAVFEFTQGTYDAYLASGAEAGLMGAVTEHRGFYTANGGGVVQFFANGLIISEHRGGNTVLLPYGPIYEYYNTQAGGIFGSLGYPTSNQTSANGVTTQRFQNGTLTYNGSTVTRS